MKKNKFSALPLEEKLLKKVMTFYQTVWAEKRLNASSHKAWLANFSDVGPVDEKLNSLYLLSKFMFFGLEEIRELLFSLYRDKFKYKIVEEFRKKNADTRDLDLINRAFTNELTKTRFVGLGKPSESGAYLLYHFRLVCHLPTSLFKNESEIVSNGRLAEPSVTRYIFLDDFCGSGETGIKCNPLIKEIKALNTSAEIFYYVLFTTETGLNNMNKYSKFDKLESIFLLDQSFKCFESTSRYYSETDPEIDKDATKIFSEKYGTPLVLDTPVDGHPLGFDNGQLLLSFSHNTPDNTLPIFWSDKNSWKPFFLRYIKEHNL